jgi:polyisoprenoid-binding protein YceI
MQTKPFIGRNEICRALMICGFLLLAGGAKAATYAAKDCEMAFETTGSPVLVKIVGKSKKPCQGKFDVDGDAIKVAELSLELNDLDTGIPLRNKHLRENYIHVEKFPSATLTVSEAKDLKAKMAGTSKDESDFNGTLTFHGKTAPVRAGKYSIKKNTVTATFDIDLGDHSVEKPSFMGVKVVDLVHLKVTFVLQ